MEKARLDKIIAAGGRYSRREVRQLIRQGRVLVDGVPKNSCVLLARNLEGADILTIEGVSHDGHLHPVQQAFVDAGAIQCGYCTPGMVMTSLALLANNPDPSEDEILTALEGNLCRCTGYKKIVEAVQLTARRMREDDGAQQG